MESAENFKKFIDSMPDEEFLLKVKEISNENIESPELQEYIDNLQDNSYTCFGCEFHDGFGCLNTEGDCEIND